MIEIEIAARPHQVDLVNYFRDGGKHGFACWHRRSGKDYAASFIESQIAFRETCLVWHCFPEFAHARRAIWDNITRAGERLIDVMFPPSLIEKKSDQEMKITMKNGSIWQAVGADKYDSLIGSNPKHVTFSEYAVQNPMARDIIRPILAENGGSELIITTPRGYNHAWDTWSIAERSEHWFSSLKTVDDTRLLTPKALATERDEMPDELFRQEYYCDWSAANVGSIYGRYLEVAEKEGRIGNFPHDPDLPVIISSDIGYRDTAAWWFWQAQPEGLTLVNYDEWAGNDAEESVDRLGVIGRENGYRYDTIWLPHDAKAKTFATRHPAVDVFRQSGLAVTRLVPLSKKADYINAGRVVLKTCRFHAVPCARGLAALRDWHYLYNPERKMRSAEPDHTWSSHAAESFSYGCQVLLPFRPTAPVTPSVIARPISYSFNLEDMYAERDAANHKW